MICDDESNQNINPETFGLLHHLARLRLAARRLTVIDATNLQFRARRPLLRMARAHRLPVVAIVFQVSLAACFRHNRTRPQRFVSEVVLEQHAQQLAMALARLECEGYHRIYLLNEANIASAEVKIKRSEDRR